MAARKLPACDPPRAAKARLDPDCIQVLIRVVFNLAIEMSLGPPDVNSFVFNVHFIFPTPRATVTVSVTS
jgi:hypothetical protein